MPLTALPHRTTTPSAVAAEPAAPTAIGPAASPLPVTSGANAEVILVKSGYRHVATRIREIIYVEASRNYVRLHLQNRVVLKSRVPIDHLARHLGTERFMRIHRSRLVGIEHIRSVSPMVGGRLALIMSDGSRVIVARDRRRVVLAELGAATASGSRTSAVPARADRSTG